MSNYLKLFLILIGIIEGCSKEKVGESVVFLQKVRDSTHNWIFKEDGEIFGTGDEGEILKFDGDKYQIKSKVPLDREDYQNDTFWAQACYVERRH